MGVGAATAVVTGAGVVGGAEVVVFVVTVAFVTDFLLDALAADFLADTFLVAARVDEEAVTTVTAVTSTASAKGALLRGNDQQVFAKTGVRMLDSNAE